MEELLQKSIAETRGLLKALETAEHVLSSSVGPRPPVAMIK